MSCIHYKFKSSIDYNSVTFDGLHLSLGDLKKAISAQKRLKPGEFDLEIVNAQTGDVYKKLDELIAKNTSVIVSRVPVTKTTASSTQKSWEAFKQECAAKVKEKERQMNLEKTKQTQDLASSSASEMDKIKAVIDLSTRGFEPSSLPGRHPSAVPSDSYICKRCGKKGHFVTQCPNVKSEDRIIEPRVKRTTGIPSTMLTIVSDPLHPGALLTNQGQFAVPTVDVEAYRESKKERPPFLPNERGPEPERKKIPQELLCHICEDLCVDAAIAPCCGTSFCDECLRGELLESDNHQCPSCHETNVSPDRIVANRSMRIAVTNFLNDTGYTKVKRRRSNSAGGETAPTQENISATVPQDTGISNITNALTNPSTTVTNAAPITNAAPSVPSTNSNSSVTLHAGDSTHPPYHHPPRDRPHPRGGYHSVHDQNAPARHHYPPRQWPRNKEPFGSQSLQEEVPRNMRHTNYKPADRNPWELQPPNMPSTLASALAPNVAAVASQAVQAVQAALLSQVHPILSAPPPSLLPYPGYPPSFVRPGMPPTTVIPAQLPYALPVEPPLSEAEFYKRQKLMQSTTLPKKQVDVFESFADLTKMRSPTPELRSRSTSPTGTPPRKKSRSRTKSPLNIHSLSRGSSPRRLRSRSLTPSRPRTPIRSRSRSRQRSQVSHSPSNFSRSQNRSRTRSPVQSRLSKVGSSSKSPIRRSKLRSRSTSKGRLSKPRSRSFSPLPPLRRSSKSPPPRRSSKSPLPLRSRSRSRSFKRSVRTRSRSWSRPRRSRSRSYSPLPRSPKRSPRRRSSRSLTPRRSYSPRRRSRSFSPRRKSPYRSRTRSPPPQKRFSRSLSRSPRSKRRSYSPLGPKRSRSPYRRPLSPVPARQRSPSPHYGRGYRGRGRGRGSFNRDGIRNDRDPPRHFPSPPRHATSIAAPNRSVPPPTSNFPPVPYLPSMGIPPPEEYFKYNPAGYEEFVRSFYAQLGSQVPTWNPQQGNGVPPPQANPFPPIQAAAPIDQPQPDNRVAWDPVQITPSQRPPHSYIAPPNTVNHSPKYGDPGHRDGFRPIMNDRDRDREEMGRERRMDERRFDDRGGDSKDRIFHNRDRRTDFRDRRMDDRDRRFEDRNRRVDDKERRGDRDRGRDFENRREKNDSDRSKDRENDRSKEKDSGRFRDKLASGENEKSKDKDSGRFRDKLASGENERSKDKDSGRFRDKLSSERKRSPRRNSKEREKNKSKEKKRVDKEKNKEPKDKVKSKSSKSEKENTKEFEAMKDIQTEEKAESKIKDSLDLATKPSTLLQSSHSENCIEAKSEDTVLKTAETVPTDDKSTQQHNKNVGTVKEKKVVGKKKTGALGLKKVKVKDATSDGTVSGEKKVKKTKKKKLTFGSSDADKKQGLKKKKLKRLVDYKSETNCMSEDGDHEKSGLGVSPAKKSKTEEAISHSSESTLKEEEPLNASSDDLKPDTDFTHPEALGSSPNPHADGFDHKKTNKETPDKAKSDLIPELPQLSKWDRDDFDLMDTLESPIKEKPKEKSIVPRSIVDKAEKFLSQKPMKNSVVAPVFSAGSKSDDEKAPSRHRGSRSKSPISKPARKVYMDSRRDSKDKKSMDIQITVKGDKRKNDSFRKMPVSSSKSSEDSYRRSHHYYSKDAAYEEDERSVVKSSSLERELKDDRSPPSHRSRKSGSKLERTSSRDKVSKHESKRDQEKHQSKPREKSPQPPKKYEKDWRPSKDDKENSGSSVKPVKDLRSRIDEKTKSKSSTESRRMSVMDESEFVPDYEDLAPDATSDNEHSSQTSRASSHDEKESRKRKSEEEKEDEDQSGVKHKKAKKKHKHKEKKEKKEKHKHKKKKHKNKKSKEREEN